MTIHLLLALASLAADGPLGCDATTPNGERWWTPVRDEVYLQEVGLKIPSESPLTAVAVWDGRVYTGDANGVHLLDGEALVPAGGLPGPVRVLRNMADSLYAITGSGLHRFDGQSWRKLGDGDFRGLCLHLGQPHAATARSLLRIESGHLVPVENAQQSPLDIIDIASYSETLYVLGRGGLAFFDGERFNRGDVADWGQLPARDTRALHRQGSRLYIATGEGLGLLRGMALTAIQGPQGLPYEDVTCVADGFAKDLWVGTSMGAVRHVDGAYHYFMAGRWLPHDKVNAIACRAAGQGGETNAVYIATDGGLGIIEYVPYTLRKKAAFYERHLEEWGQKRLGFTHKLEWDPALNEWVREVSDNDVGWSTHYLAAQCFKYAVTGDEAAREEAVDFFKSVKWSEEITSIDGFPARSIWAVGERGHQAQHGSGGLPAEWHATPDGKWQWKADTSSDETDAHFYAVSLFHDLAAKGIEKEKAREHIDRVASHIVREGWVLRDLDGKPTRWARWDPEYFHSYDGNHARGLNGLEILSYLETAHKLTGDAKYQEAAQTLIGLRYLEEIPRQKLVFHPGYIFHSDDRLAFYNYFPLLRYETDPKLRSVYMRSLERSWEIERIEHNPWFNFIYGAVTGNDCEVAQAVRHMREWPLDLVKHRYQNSHRTDLYTPEGYGTYSGGIKAISPRVSGPMRWSSSTLYLDGGGGGQVVDPSGWLEAYWMGRYFGFIQPPVTEDPELLTVEPAHRQLGAKPYDGPPRPDIF